jgi:hypothetical protein
MRTLFGQGPSMSTRSQNERKFGSWRSLEDGKRLYWLDVKGKMNWTARYLKLVDQQENTIRFWQEIFNEQGLLVEVHQKYPIDLGHQRQMEQDS